VRQLEASADKLADVLMWIACVAGFLMMIHVTIDVTGRVLFNNPLEGTIEIASGYYMVAVSFLPLAYVSRYEGQIIVELFTRNLSPPRLARLDAVVAVITIVYVAVFAWHTGHMAVEQTEVGEVWEMGDNFIDVWPSRWLLPVSFAALAFYLAVRTVRDLRDVSQNKS